MSPYFDDKLSLFLIEVSFETSEENGYFLKKIFEDLMNHIIMEYAGEKIKQFLKVSPLKIMDFLLSLFQPIRP